MNLQELQNSINEGKIKVYEDLRQRFRASDDTIRRRFNDLGLKWNYRTKTLEGTLNEEQAQMDADNFFKKKDNPISNANASAHKSKSKQTDAQTKANLHSTANASKSEIESTEMQLDIFDMLLQPQAIKKPKRVSRSFYIDQDILPILDNVKGGLKSDLVNEALRKVFKDKGLLK